MSALYCPLDNFEFYQIPYLLIVTWSATLMASGLLLYRAKNRNILKTSVWLMLLCVVNILLMFTRPGIFLIMALHAVLFVSAPIGASAIALAFTVFGIFSFFTLLFMPAKP